MEFNDFVLVVNSSCIIILMVLAIILLTATRFRTELAYAAAIIVFPNVPVYLYNASTLLWHDLALFMFPISISVNLLLMPLLWLFAKASFDNSFRLRPIHLLHLLPALICLVLSLAMSQEQRLEAIRHEMTGGTSLVTDINTIFIFIQMIAYFTVIFRFLHRVRKNIGDTLSDAEWVQKSWILVFEYLFAALFVIVMICFFISPSTGTWLIQILNVVAMFYLVYNLIAHPVMPIKQSPMEIAANDNISETANAEAPYTQTLIMEEQQMKEICEKASQYLEESKAYLRPDISLALFSKEINIPQRKLSLAINGYLKCNFFEFVNRMRIEEAKHLLQKLDTSKLNIDTIYADCGFRSRSTFYMVFKKMTGKTPASYLNDR